eukprot:PhF_6_TR17268/c0_g1_i1/m.26483
MDRFQLTSRFIRPQKECYRTALAEIQRGRKESCWSWYIFPTPPYIVNGVERGSPTNRLHCLRSPEEVHAYLTFPTCDGINLRNNYLEITNAVNEQLRAHHTFERLFGFVDAPKVKASLELFRDVSSTELYRDQDIAEVCNKVLKRM